MKKGLFFLIVPLLTVYYFACSDARSEQKRTGTSVIDQSGSKQALPENSTFNPGIETQSIVSEATLNPVLPGDTLKPDTLAGEIIKLSKEDFLRKVWDFEKSPQQWNYLGDKPAIIDFYADWCGPCRIASPILDEISKEFADQITVYKIDTQKERELAAVFGVRSIPAFLYIPQSGKPAMTAGIARTKEDTRKMFVDHINSLLLQAVK